VATVSKFFLIVCALPEGVKNNEYQQTEALAEYARRCGLQPVPALSEEQEFSTSVRY
jgi:hypothetical protein